MSKRSFSLHLDWTIRQNFVEKLDVHLITSQDFSDFFFSQSKDWEEVFFSGEWLSVEEYSFLKTFFSYS
ncbi:MAG: hypothetical protein ACK4TN_01465, partial [Brevinematales bacterium]